jgi:hypothetical protein
LGEKMRLQNFGHGVFKESFQTVFFNSGHGSSLSKKNV